MSDRLMEDLLAQVTAFERNMEAVVLGQVKTALGAVWATSTEEDQDPHSSRLAKGNEVIVPFSDVTVVVTVTAEVPTYEDPAFD